MKNKLISFILALCMLIAIPLSARYKYNPFTRKLDYYLASADVDLGDLGDITLTGLAPGNILYYNGAAWVNLATGANTNVLTLAVGIPSWAATGAPAAHAASHEVAGADLVDHDLLTNYVANEHIDHTAITLTAAGLITGGGTIVANRTFTLTEATIEAAIDTLANLTSIQGQAISLANSLTVEVGGAAVLNQDLTTDAAPTFATLNLVNAVSSYADITITGDKQNAGITLVGYTGVGTPEFGMSFPAGYGGFFTLYADGANLTPYLWFKTDLDNTKTEIGGNLSLDFKPNDETDDYISMLVTADVPEITSIGGSEFKITSDGGTINFNDELIKTTGDAEVKDITISTPVNVYALSHNSFADYAANQHVVLPATIAAVLTDHNLAAHTALGIPNPANVFYVSATGGDYTTIQAALNAQNAGGETFLVGPGTYADTIRFTANDQVVKALGNIPNVIVTQADANIVDGGAWSDCMVQSIDIRLTAPTTAINAIQVGTGILMVYECRVYLATAIALVQADQPSLVGFTDAGTIRIGRGNYQYYHTGNTGGGGIKAAFRANVNLAELHLHKIDVVIITNSGTAAVTSMYVTTGTAMTEMHNVVDATITDPEATLVVGLGYVGGAGAHNVQGNHVDIVATNNTSYGLYHNGTGTVRSGFNALHASDVAGASYAFYVGGTATLISHFDDLRSGDGNSVTGTLTFVNSPADGDLAITDELDVTGVSEFSGDTYQYEDVFITWADAADHMRIIQGNAAGIEAQALIFINDDRIGATANEADEATLHMTGEGPDSWAIYADIGKVQWDGNVLWSWASDVDNARITQTAVAGIEDQPLISIDDDRIGATANEWGEASLVIEAAGIYALSVLDGQFYVDDIMTVTGAVYFQNQVHVADNFSFDLGYFNSYVKWDTNAAADDLTVWTWGTKTANDSLAFFFTYLLDPNGMTDHDDYLSPTFIIANDEAADANDYAGVVIGERTQASVLVAHYFDFYAMTGAVDGAVDPNVVEIGATFRFGDSGTTVPTYATGPGDVIFEDDVEIIGTSHGLGDATKYEDVFWTWGDAADHAFIDQNSESGIEDQPLIQIADDREGATANEASEATFFITGAGAYAFVVNSGNTLFDDSNVEFYEDVFWTWASTADHAVIAQSNVAGTEGQPLVFYNDDRTGATANSKEEATIRIDAEGTYAIYIEDGSFYNAQSTDLHGSIGVNNVLTMAHDKPLAIGTSYASFWRWTTNGAQDDFLQLSFSDNASATKMIFMLGENLEPSGMTDHANYEPPNIVWANTFGADANDYAGVVLGERTQADVEVPHYFDFFVMTGSIDGSVDPTTTEIPAIFRFGASGTAIPDYATTPGDVLFEGTVEVDGETYLDDNLFTEGYNRTLTLYWQDSFDHGSTAAKYGQDWNLTALNVQGAGTNTIDTTPSRITLTTDNNAIGDNEGTRTDSAVIERSRQNRSQFGVDLGQTVNTQFYCGWNTSGTNAMVAAVDEYVIIFFDHSDNPNWQLKVGDGATEDVFTSAVAVDTNHICLEIWVETDGTVHLAIDHVEIDITGSVDNLMDAANHYLIVGQAQSVAGAAIIVAEIDFVENEKMKDH